MKTKFLILALMLIVFSRAFAQELNEKLLVKYTESELVKMKQMSPDIYLTNSIRVTENKGYYFTEMPTKEVKQIKQLKKIDPNTGTELTTAITDLDFINFNPLNYNCTPNFDENAYYQFGNTGKLLILFPEKHVKRLVDMEILNNK